MPFVVFYVREGKATAQKALNKLNALFAQHPEIRGSGEQPRFNAKVTPLLWVAQGAGDDKEIPENASFYEPSKIYYRPDVTGGVENYHLVHPETGRELTE